MTEVEWQVRREQGQVVVAALDDEDVTFYFLEPLQAAALAAALFDKAVQEEDDSEGN